MRLKAAELPDRLIRPMDLPSPVKGQTFDEYAGLQGENYSLGLKYEWEQMGGIKLPGLRRVGIVTGAPFKLAGGWLYEFPLSLNKMHLFYPELKGKMASLRKMARISFYDLYDIPAFMLLTVIESMKKSGSSFLGVRQDSRLYYMNLRTLLMSYFDCYGYWHPGTKDVTLPGFLDIEWLMQDSRIIEYNCARLKQIVLLQAFYWLKNYALAYCFQKEGVPWDDELDPEICSQINDWYDFNQIGYYLEEAVLVPRRKLALV
ncbi:MAG: hypothetical protein K6T65_07085 [Peptococcaceae bacterium]|nr:hypothetical protein [Peptococcaceae bacterium]